MKSTGEVMGLDRDRGLAYLKSQLASGNKVPSQGNIFVSLKDEDKQKAVPLIRQLVNLGYELYATRGTSTMLYNEGIKTRAVLRISRGRPNLLDLIHDKEVQWIVNTTETGAEAMVDECQRSEESENMLAYSHLTSKETVRKAYKSRCAPRLWSLAFLSRRPSPPSPLPSKAWKTGWPLIQDVTRPQRPAFRAATQPRLPCLRSQGTSTTSEDSKCAVCKSTTGT